MRVQHAGPEHSDAEHAGPEHCDAQHGHTKVLHYRLTIAMIYAISWIGILLWEERHGLVCMEQCLFSCLVGVRLLYTLSTHMVPYAYEYP